jgi:formamidase
VLEAMIDYIAEECGYTRVEAWMIASLAVEMRTGQPVYVSNVGVTAILPQDVFVGLQ